MIFVLSTGVIIIFFHRTNFDGPFAQEITVPVHVGFPTKIEARFPIELLRRDILFCDGNMDCGNSLSLKLPDNAFNQINGQSLVLPIPLNSIAISFLVYHPFDSHPYHPSRVYLLPS
jgi:hypothetical protein